MSLVGFPGIAFTGLVGSFLPSAALGSSTNDSHVYSFSEVYPWGNLASSHSDVWLYMESLDIRQIVLSHGTGDHIEES